MIIAPVFFFITNRTFVFLKSYKMFCNIKFSFYFDDNLYHRIALAKIFFLR